MTTRVAMLALVCIGASGFAIAQEQSPPPDTTSPSTSRQPGPKEAPATGSSTSRPPSASSPHQRQATRKETTEQMMKDCIAKAHAADSSVSESDAKKACKERIGSRPESSNR